MRPARLVSLDPLSGPSAQNRHEGGLAATFGMHMQTQS